MGTPDTSRATVTPPSSPYTDLLPPLTEAEYQALVDDIRVRGVLVAVEYTVDGVLIDGANRVRAATELGVPYPRVVRSGLETQEARIAHAFALHAHRRHLTPEARLELIARLRSDGLSVRAISAAIGVPKSTVAAHVAGVPIGTPGNAETVGLDGKTYSRARRKPVGPAGITVGSAAEQNRASAALTSLAAGAPTGRQLTLHRAERLAREALLQAARTNVDDAPMPATIDLRLGDFREVLADLPDASVDLVLTDPPWTLAAIRDGIFADVAAVSSRLLRPGGHLAAYTGTQHLPQVLALLEGVKDLDYRWTIAIANGDSTAANARLPRVSSRWRPVVIYRKVGGEKATWLPTDFIEGGGRERSLHRWQQSESEAEQLIEMLTEPGALVVDPCAGSATFGVAAHRTRRSFIGAEIDPETYQIARSRLAQLDG